MTASYGADQKLKPEAVRRFAHQVAQRLEEGLSQHSFDRLYVIAERAFLGDLRHALGDNTTKVLAGTVNTNLTRNFLDDIRAQLPDFL